MNAAGWVAAHKVPVLVVGGAAAVGLGLLKRKSSAAAASGTTAAAGTPGSMTGMVPTFDSTMNDVYSSIEPQISAQAGQLAGLSTSLTDIQTQLAHLSAPTPSQPPPSAAPTPAITLPAPAPIIPPSVPAQNVNFSVNDPAANPKVSPAPPITLNTGDALGPATGSGQRYVLPGGDHTLVYG